MTRKVLKVFFSLGIITCLITQNITLAAVNDRSSQNVPRRLTLEQCIQIALENNHRQPASELAIEIAEAQHKQALSSYWPMLKLESTLTRMDEDLINVTETMTTTSVNTAYVTLGKGGPVVSGPIYTNVSSDVDEQTTKIMDRDNINTSVSLVYPLYTGGKRSAIVRQAKKGLEAAKEEARRTGLEIIYDVKRMYFSAVLARELLILGKDTLARMEATLELTQNMYEGGSGSVKKTDFLRNKIIVEALRSTLASLKSNEQVAKAALVNTMGLDWDTPIEVSAPEIPFTPYQADLKALISNSYTFNPDWMRLKAGLDAAEAKIKESKSGYLPKIACFGKLNRMENSYSYGTMNPQNRNSWIIGLGIEIPVFDGFLTLNQVREARARLKKLEHEKILLREGLALQVKHIFLQMDGAKGQYSALKEAVSAAEENRELNVRAYHDELVETKEVIESQMMEAFMKAQYLKSLYDHIEAQAHLGLVVGKEVSQRLQGD